MFDAKKYYNQDSYFDGIPSEVEKHNSKLTLEELESEIEAERKNCEKMKCWDDLKED